MLVGPQFMLKYVDVYGSGINRLHILSHALCQRESSILYQCLIGSRFTKWKYQHLSHVVNIPVPVRCSFDKPWDGRREAWLEVEIDFRFPSSFSAVKR